VTEKEIKELRELCERATPGPWSVPDAGYYGRFGLCWSIKGPKPAQTPAQTNERDNANFIARARTALPALLDEVAYYREREDYFQRVLKISDGGQYRADWEAPLQQLIVDRDSLRALMRELVEWMERSGIESSEFSAGYDLWRRAREAVKP